MPRYPHTIRLRGPWEFEAVSGDAAVRAGRVKLPGDSGAMLGPAFRGRVRYRRAFHQPTGLDPHEHVWLVCEGANAFGQIACNGQVLGDVTATHACEFEITAILRASNEVQFEVESPGGPIGEVRLEVRERQFLNPCRFLWSLLDQQPTLRLEGCIAGEACDAPLEVVVRSPEEELLYAALAVGAPFTLTSHTTAPIEHPLDLEVRLLRGATRVWEARHTVYFDSKNS